MLVRSEIARKLPEELLSTYLSLSNEERKLRFLGTSEAARLTGLSRRTIQLWIEMGHIQAVPIGRRYQIDMTSLRLRLEQAAKNF